MTQEFVMRRMSLTGIGAGVYFDFSTFSFHVPRELSAPNAAIVVVARTTSALVRMFRIAGPREVLCYGCLRSKCAEGTPNPIRHPG